MKSREFLKESTMRGIQHATLESKVINDLLQSEGFAGTLGVRAGLNGFDALRQRGSAIHGVSEGVQCTAV